MSNRIRREQDFRISNNSRHLSLGKVTINNSNSSRSLSCKGTKTSSFSSKILVITTGNHSKLFLRLRRSSNLGSRRVKMRYSNSNLLITSNSSRLPSMTKVFNNPSKSLIKGNLISLINSNTIKYLKDSLKVSS